MEKKLYSENLEFKIVESGNFNGYPYWITSVGTHPCAYVGIKNYIGEEIQEEIAVHGGITYMSKCLPDGREVSGCHIIGWDYTLPGDFLYFSEPFGVREWQIWEIREEAIGVIKQLLEMGEK